MEGSTTGVWWDLNTCPVPAGFNPRRVRRRIESALRRVYKDERPVTIFAVGNLEYISLDILKAISSSGILLRHTVFRWMHVGMLMSRWTKCNPSPAKILLISGDGSWFYPDYDFPIVPDGYTMLRSFPEDCFWKIYSHATREWFWNNLLKEKKSPGKTKRIDSDKNACVCELCETPSQSFDDFIKHLRSSEHRLQLFNSVAIDNGKPLLICELCQYPGYDGHNMNIHLKSDEHKRNLLLDSKNVVCCKVCKSTWEDNDKMAIHYNSEEHTQKELDSLLDIVASKRRKWDESDEEEDSASLKTTLEDNLLETAHKKR